MAMSGTLVVVGSGPVGMTSALLLKHRFERVVILERQTKERFLRTRGFTFPIVFSPAARTVLDSVDVLDAMDQERSPYFGVVVHKRVLGMELTWTAKRGGIYSHWRNHIVSTLHDRIRAEGIEVHFESDLQDIDFANNICTEATIGALPFDLLLGADGVNSQTRQLMAQAHENTDAFRTELLDRWYAYRLPAEGALGERFGSGDHGHALHVHTDNLRRYPDSKFRVITVAMTQPHHEISVVIKHGVDLDPEHVRQLNTEFFKKLVEDEVLNTEWADGVGGGYRHVTVPTFRFGSALLVGDAAHGFEGNGDLINLGISSVSSLPGLLDADTIPAALTTYDDTVGQALRDYSVMARRRSLEKINVEVAAFEAGALLRLNGHHPSMWGIYEDDFEISAYMQRYKRERNRLRAVGAVLAGAALISGLGRSRTHSA